MHHAFIDFVQAEKQRGKTIFLSSHIFSEVDAVCDRIGIIKDGHIVSEFFEGELKDAGTKTYRIVFANADAYQTFLAAGFNVIGKSESSLRVRVKVETAQVQTLVALLSTLDVADFTEIPFTLEDYFMGFYETDKDFAEVEQ